jgi:uncharacterized protein (TIGR03000 family)
VFNAPPPPAVPSYRSWYSTEEEPAARMDRSALITLKVPENAEVWFSGTKTHANGTSRDYITPELNPGQSYSYRVRIIWEKDGRMHDETRKITVNPGQHLTVDMKQPAKDSSVAHSR